MISWKRFYFIQNTKMHNRKSFYLTEMFYHVAPCSCCSCTQCRCRCCTVCSIKLTQSKFVQSWKKKENETILLSVFTWIIISVWLTDIVPNDEFEKFTSKKYLIFSSESFCCVLSHAIKRLEIDKKLLKIWRLTKFHLGNNR